MIIFDSREIKLTLSLSLCTLACSQALAIVRNNEKACTFRFLSFTLLPLYERVLILAQHFRTDSFFRPDTNTEANFSPTPVLRRDSIHTYDRFVSVCSCRMDPIVTIAQL